MSEKSQALRLINNLLADIREPDFVWQVVALLACIGSALLIARWWRSRHEEGSGRLNDASARLAFPLTGMVLTGIALTTLAEQAYIESGPVVLEFSQITHLDCINTFRFDALCQIGNVQQAGNAVAPFGAPRCFIQAGIPVRPRYSKAQGVARHDVIAQAQTGVEHPANHAVMLQTGASIKQQ